MAPVKFINRAMEKRAGSDRGRKLRRKSSYIDTRKTEHASKMSVFIMCDPEAYAKINASKPKDQSMPRPRTRATNQNQPRTNRVRVIDPRETHPRTRARARQTEASRGASVSAAMASSRRSSQGARQYMFIDSEADRNTSSEAIRVHVMRESHRARRQLRGLFEPTSSHGQMTILAPTTPTQSRRERTHSLPTSARESPSRDTSVAQSPQRAPSPSTDLKMLARNAMTALLSISDVKFSTACVGLEVLHTLPENIFDLCQNDPAALHSLIALVMSVQNTVDVLYAAECESSALEILRSRISASTTAEHSDETMMTVFLLSRLERSRMNNATAAFHEAALRRMVHDRGGYDNLQTSNRTLYDMLNNCGLGPEAQ